MILEHKGFHLSFSNNKNNHLIWWLLGNVGRTKPSARVKGEMVFLSVLLQIRHAAIFEWGTALCSLKLEFRRTVVARQRLGTAPSLSGARVFTNLECKTS